MCELGTRPHTLTLALRELQPMRALSVENACAEYWKGTPQRTRGGTRGEKAEGLVVCVVFVDGILWWRREGKISGGGERERPTGKDKS